MKLTYIDRLSVWSLIALVFSRRNGASVFYLNSTKKGEKLVRILKRLGILEISLQALDFRMADIRDASGNLLFVKVEEDVTDVCFTIGNCEVISNNFLKRLPPELNFKKTVLYLEKIIAQEIRDMIVYLNVAQWHARNQADCVDRTIVFFMAKGLWSKYLADYVRCSGVEPIEYLTVKQPSLFRTLLRVVRSAREELQKKVIHPSGGAGESSQIKNTDVSVSESSREPLIASWYTGKSITFDLDKRSDFFWLLKSPIPYNQVMLYFERTDIAMSTDEIDLLKQKGMQAVFLKQPLASKVSPIWRPTKACKRIERYLFSGIVKNFVFSSIARLKRVPLFYLFKMLAYAKDYSYWFDFFQSHNVKININNNIFTAQHIPQKAALEKYGGCSVAYQLPNFWFSSVGWSSCADVMFLFSPAYQWVWEKNRSVINNYVSCGYITDYSFEMVRDSALQTRESLLKKGAQFVICYFDENSSDDRMSLIPNDRAIRIYKYFLERTLEDKTIGLICKPGYPRTLGKRLLPIRNLIEDVKASGRCIFIEDGKYLTDKYPSEAAQAADLCVALLLGGAAALESFLSHIPTVFLDLEGLCFNPVYQKGRDKVVFNDLDALFSAIQKFRKNPASVLGFGDLSSWAKDKDLFKDGNASLRMGEYLNWLLEKFNQGLNREEALDYANQKFNEKWALKINNDKTSMICSDREMMKGIPCGS